MNDQSKSKRRRSAPRRILVGFLGSLLLAGLLVLTPGTAQAATVTSGVNIRPCVTSTGGVCSPVGTTGNTTIKTIRCWRDGAWATGAYRSNRWFLVYLADGREGYVHSSFVHGQYPTPECTTLAYVRAADKALSYVGQIYANSDIASKYPNSDWAPGPVGEWSGDCAKLVSSSYRYGAGLSYSSGNAIDQYNYYKSRDLVYSGLPRYGAPVFYRISDPRGHTAIYVGGTTIVSTQGFDNAKLPVTLRGIYSVGSYLGWAKLG